MDFNHHHHRQQTPEQKELTKAMTGLVHAMTCFVKEATQALKQFEASQKPKGRLMFTFGTPTDKTQN